MTILEVIYSVLSIFFLSFIEFWETLFRINTPMTESGTYIYLFPSVGDIVLFFLYSSVFIYYLFRLVKGVDDSD